MNPIIESYKKAFDDIMTSAEIDRIRKSSKSHYERRMIKRLKECYQPNLPIWSTLPVVSRCPLLISDIITFMVLHAQTEDSENGKRE